MIDNKCHMGGPGGGPGGSKKCAKSVTYYLNSPLFGIGNFDHTNQMITLAVITIKRLPLYLIVLPFNRQQQLQHPVQDQQLLGN